MAIESYENIPLGEGTKVYLHLDWIDPGLYTTLIRRGYRVISDITRTDSDTIFLCQQREITGASTVKEYVSLLDKRVADSLARQGIRKPLTINFSLKDLLDYKYTLPFVFKNETLNGGKEKFLIETEEDYEKLIDLFYYITLHDDGTNNLLSKYQKYLENNFVVQEYIETPTRYNTTLRVVTSSSGDLFYSTLKYNEPAPVADNTSLISNYLTHYNPLESKSIVSNTLQGGSNIRLDGRKHTEEEKSILSEHNIGSASFEKVLTSSIETNQKLQRELGIICGYDFIYDKNKDAWRLLEYHTKPMVSDFALKRNLPYITKEDKLVADGAIRAEGLTLTMNKRTK